MSWYNILKRWDFGFAYKDIWYILDWRKPVKGSVRKFLKEQLSVAHKLYVNGTLPRLHGTQDNKVINALRWVKENITYEVDSKRFGVAEKWQTIEETLNFKKGDCEDGAILLFCILYVNRVNVLQFKLVTGDVKGGGHCWLEYMPDQTFGQYSLGTWYTMDWCYWYSPAQFGSRTAKDESKYLKDWWSIGAVNLS